MVGGDGADSNFIVIICIMELVYDFNNDADEIALARREFATNQGSV